MGDISDMMLEGTLCQYCGVFLGPVPQENMTPEEETVFKKMEDSWEPCGYPNACDICIP